MFFYVPCRDRVTERFHIFIVPLDVRRFADLSGMRAAEGRHRRSSQAPRRPSGRRLSTPPSRGCPHLTQPNLALLRLEALAGVGPFARRGELLDHALDVGGQPQLQEKRESSRALSLAHDPLVAEAALRPAKARAKGRPPPRDLWPALLRGDPRLRQRGDHARGLRRGSFPVSLEAAADRQRQAHDREARLDARLGRRRPGLRGEGERGSGGGVEPAAARDRAQVAPEGRRGAWLERRWRPSAARVRSRSAKRRDVYEYSVLVTSLDEDVEAFGQLYRDRATEKNIFDEMKNQWGWAGYTTHDLARCRLAARGACAHLQLVEHLRPARRSPPPSRGDHQPSPVPDGDRHPHPSCAANDDPRDELARQGRARRPGACGRRRLPAGPGQKCGAVDPPANMASDLVARLPGLPQRPPPPRPAPPRAKLMQPKREKSLTPKRHIGQLPFLGLMLPFRFAHNEADAAAFRRAL